MSSSKIYIIFGVGLIAALLVGYYLFNRYMASASSQKGLQVSEDKGAAKIDQQSPTTTTTSLTSEPVGQGTIYELSADDVPNILAKEKNVVIMVYKPSCVHCHRMAPELDKAAINYHGCTWSRLNGEAFPQAVQYLKANVSGFPTVIHYINGQPVNVLVGYRPSEQLLQDIKNPKVAKQ